VPWNQSPTRAALLCKKSSTEKLKTFSGSILDQNHVIEITQNALLKEEVQKMQKKHQYK
jgi:hypothetical protein